MAVIKLSSTISSQYIYKELMPEINRAIQENKKEKLQLSLKETEYISPHATTLLLWIGVALKSFFNNQPIELLLKYEKHLLLFLESSFFFKISDDRGLFTYNRDLVGGFDKRYRKEHRIHEFDDCPKYRELQSEKEITMFRDELFKETKMYFRYLSGINDVKKFNEVSEISIDAFCEIVVNAKIHSASDSFGFFQSNKLGTFMSIADKGVGFSSINGKAFSNIIRLKNPDLGGHEDLLLILDAMEYARRKKEIEDRENLFTVWEDVRNNRGTFRIHSNRTQLVFGACCEKCEKYFSGCVNCLVSREGSKYKRFTSTLPGVHIEIDIPNKYSRKA